MTGPQSPYPHNGHGPYTQQPHGNNQPSGQRVYGQAGPGYQYNPNNPNQGRIPSFGSLAYYDPNIGDNKARRFVILLLIALVTIAAIAATVFFGWNSQQALNADEPPPASSIPAASPDRTESTEQQPPAAQETQAPRADAPREAGEDTASEDVAASPDPIELPFPTEVSGFTLTDSYPADSRMQSYENGSGGVRSVNIYGAWADMEEILGTPNQGNWVCEDNGRSSQCQIVDRQTNVVISVIGTDTPEVIAAWSEEFYQAYLAGQ